MYQGSVGTQDYLLHQAAVRRGKVNEMKSLIESKYKGTPYYDQMMSNPYFSVMDSDFEPSMWQKGAMFFGDNSGYNRWYNENLQLMNAYQADLVSQFEAQKYESAPNQAALNEAAGLNMALGAGVSSPAAENDNAVNMPVVDASKGESEMQAAVTFIANSMFSALSGAMDFASKVQDYQMKDFEIASAEIGMHQNALNYAIQELQNTLVLPADIAQKIQNGEDLTDADLNTFDNTLLNAAQHIDYSRFSRRTRRTMFMLFHNLQRDVASGREPMALLNLRSQFLNQYSQNMLAAGTNMSHDYWNSDFNEMVKQIAKLLTKALDDTESAEVAARHARAHADAAQAASDSDYYSYRYSDDHTLSAGDSPGRMRAKSEASQFDSDNVNSEFQNTIHQIFDDTIKVIDKYKDKGWYPYVRMLIPCLEAYCIYNISPSSSR